MCCLLRSRCPFVPVVQSVLFIPSFTERGQRGWEGLGGGAGENVIKKHGLIINRVLLLFPYDLTNYNANICVDYVYNELFIQEKKLWKS
jgi:hypothetical protein